MRLGHVVKRAGTLVIALLMITACKKGPTEPEGEIPTLPPVAPGTVLFLDDFDNENGGRGVNNWTDFQNWNVVDGCVDLHGNGFYDAQPGKGLYVDLDGSCRKAGTLESKEAFNLPPGQYILEFWLAGNQVQSRANTVDVTFGTLYTEQFVKERTEPFTLYTRTIDVSSATSAKLRFKHQGGDDGGIFLDLVRLRRAE